MAGATNRQMKRAGFKSAGIQKIRNGQGGALSIRSAMRVADRVNVPTPAKAILKYGTGNEAPKGWQAAAKGGDRAAAAASATPAKSARPGLASAIGAASKGMLASRKNAAAKEVARAVYERGNEGSAARKAAMRTDIRERAQQLRDAKKDLSESRDRAEAAARKATPAAKGGPKKRANELARDSAIQSQIANNPSVQRAASIEKQARIQLQSALASRNATAMAGKQRRNAESAGQLDLFSGAPKPRAPSPFERRMALRDARAAQVGALSRSMLQRRKDNAGAIAQDKANRDFRAKSAASLDGIAFRRSMAADAAAASKAKAAKIGARQTLNASVGGRVTGNLLRDRRARAAADDASAKRVASIAEALERSAASSRFKVEKNVPITVARRGAEWNAPTRQVPATALAKAGKHAVTRGERGYDLIHVGSGLSVSSFATKAGAMSALNGMASGRGKGSDDMAAGNYSSRAAAATMRYTRMATKREYAYELKKAQDSHARAVAGGNQAVIRSAASRLASAKKFHDSHGYGTPPAKPRAGKAKVRPATTYR